MTKTEIALIRAKVDFFDNLGAEEIKLFHKCVDFVEANEHYVEAMKCCASADALRYILIELGF